tara:strand:- start:533 stop:2794 length:2262 start_codon:yes stop_codon:yes gene_type:complete
MRFNNYINKLFFVSFFSILLFASIVNAEILKKIIIEGNDRISDETIILFSSVKINQNVDDKDLNKIIEELYKTNYFKNIATSFNDNTLKITVEENPIIGEINFEGVKAKKVLNIIKLDLLLKPRSSYNLFELENDRDNIINSLKNLGYYAAEVEVFVDEKSKNIIDVIYKINLGEKAKIKKIIFNGDKIYKDRKLKSLIVSEEYKFWKFVSGKKYLNEKTILFDTRLLKNFYLNKGYYNVKINSSFARIIDENENEFELIFNINANEKFYFNDLSMDLPTDFNTENFKEINNLFTNLKGQIYSINKIEKILENIDKVTTEEQYISTKSTVEEDIIGNLINLKFLIQETEKIYVKKINILGNNVTKENVIRNQLEIDEGDLFNEILLTKSINNIKSLNYFKTVNYELEAIDIDKTKIINISVEEKPTGEIMAGLGFGTSGTSTVLGVKENNYLGQGVSLDAKLNLSENAIKGNFKLTNPNFKNSDKSIFVNFQALETDRLSDFGYKSNKTGLSLGTDFEYYDDFFLGLGVNSYYETIDADSTASTRQKNQAGNYFDNFVNISFDYDKRNQKFQTSDGFRNYYDVSVPLISETNTFSNTFIATNYFEYLDKNVLKTSFYFKNSSSLTGDNVKLSERLNIPGSRLRGFEQGKVGPKDGNDYIGGNFVSSLNISSTIPQIFENSQSTEFVIFLDIANIWGVDYDSSLDNSNEIRSSLGLGLDWFSPVGPMNFSLTQPISSNTNDVTESFRFNLGTTF